MPVTQLLVGCVAGMGLLIGSFLNVVIWRVPRGESLVTPASRCPACGAPVRPRDNVPVLSWVLLRGRCRDCAASIAARYPVVELATAAVSAVVAARLGLSWALPAFLYLVAAGVALAVIDIDTKRLPNIIVLPSYAVGALLLLLPAAFEGEWASYVRALLGMAALFGFFLLLFLLYPKGMGLGDVKLAGVLGLFLGWLGWAEVVIGGFLGFLLGGIVGAALIAAHRAGGKTAIPYGPFMLVGALLAVLAGDPIASWYLGYLVT